VAGYFSPTSPIPWVLRNSGPCYQNCWHTDSVGYRRWLLKIEPAIWPTWAVC